MAAPQRRPRYRTDAGQVVRRLTGRRGARGDAPARAPVRRGAVKGTSWRAFVVVVMVPVLLMLGSVYAHAVAAGLGGEVARLTEEKARAEAEAERLEVKVTELSGPERIRSLAAEDLGMRDPASEDLRTYESDGEDVTEDGEGEQKGNGG